MEFGRSRASKCGNRGGRPRIFGSFPYSEWAVLAS